MRIFDDNRGLRILTSLKIKSDTQNNGVLNQSELTEEKVMDSANLPSCAQWNKHRAGET